MGHISFHSNQNIFLSTLFSNMSISVFPSQLQKFHISIQYVDVTWNMDCITNFRFPQWFIVDVDPLFGICIVWKWAVLLMFQRYTLPSSSGLKGIFVCVHVHSYKLLVWFALPILRYSLAKTTLQIVLQPFSATVNIQSSLHSHECSYSRSHVFMIKLPIIHCHKCYVKSFLWCIFENSACLNITYKCYVTVCLSPYHTTVLDTSCKF